MESVIDSGDSAWVLVSTALVLLMTPGVAFFYGGLVRGKNVLNTMMMSLVAMGIVAVLWVVCGYSLAFGEGNAFIGYITHVSLEGIGQGAHSGTKIPAILFVAFQMTFAAITPALISVQLSSNEVWTVCCIRQRMVSFGLCPALPLGLGWRMDRRDGRSHFAGGTVVHVSAGVSAFVAALILGERKKADEEPRPHNVPFVILGASLLWFGWLDSMEDPHSPLMDLPLLL